MLIKCFYTSEHQVGLEAAALQCFPCNGPLTPPEGSRLSQDGKYISAFCVLSWLRGQGLCRAVECIKLTDAQTCKHKELQLLLGHRRQISPARKKQDPHRSELLLITWRSLIAHHKCSFDHDKDSDERKHRGFSAQCECCTLNHRTN